MDDANALFLEVAGEHAVKEWQNVCETIRGANKEGATKARFYNRLSAIAFHKLDSAGFDVTKKDKKGYDVVHWKD